MVTAKLMTQQNGYGVLLFLVSMPVLLTLVAAAIAWSLVLTLDLRLSHRCRDQALATQENLAVELKSMENLNQKILWAHRLYKLAKIGRVFPPFTGPASVVAEQLRALKVSLDLAQKALLLKIKNLISLRRAIAQTRIKEQLHQDFRLLPKFSVSVTEQRRAKNLFIQQRLDAYSTLQKERSDIASRASVHWRWQADIMMGLNPAVVRFLKSQKFNLGFISGTCSAHLQRENNQWQSYLGEPARQLLSWY